MERKHLTVVYIAGFNYSGSTLLALLLNAHPQMATTGEVIGPPNFDRGRPFTCSCGEPIQECPFYQELQRRIDMPLFDLSRGIWGTGALAPNSCGASFWFGSLRNTSAERLRDSLRQRISAANAFEKKRLLNLRFYAEAARLLGTSVIVDSSKVPMQLQFLAASPEIDLEVIHLVRHPAGCAMSAAKHNGHTLQRAATIWKRNFRTCVRQSARFAPNNTLRVRYEDLCLNPPEVLDRICRFLNIEYTPQMLNFRASEHHIVGNNMRFDRQNEILLREEWRAALSASQLDLIRRITKPESVECNYEFLPGDVTSVD